MTTRKNNEKCTYLLYAYKESELWGDDYESSELIRLYTDDSDKLVEQLWYLGYPTEPTRFNNWEVEVFIHGVKVDVATFKAPCEDRQREADRLASEYQAKLAVRRAEEEAERNALIEELSYQTYLGLKARYAHLEK